MERRHRRRIKPSGNHIAARTCCAPEGERSMTRSFEGIIVQDAKAPWSQVGAPFDNDVSPSTLGQLTAISQFHSAKVAPTEAAGNLVCCPRAHPRRGRHPYLSSVSRTGKSSFGKGITQKEGQLALFLRSYNVTPEEAAGYWKANGDPFKLGSTAQSLADKRALHLNPEGNVRVTGDAFPETR